MSWTPTFLVRKNELDKTVAKIEKQLESYSDDMDSRNSEIRSIVGKEKERLKKNMKELNVDIDSRKLEELATKQVANKIGKIHAEFDKKHKEKKQELLNKLIEDDIPSETDVIIEGKEYYYFYTEFSSEAYTFEEFLKKHKITFVVIGG